MSLWCHNLYLNTKFCPQGERDGSSSPVMHTKKAKPSDQGLDDVSHRLIFLNIGKYKTLFQHEFLTSITSLNAKMT